MAPIPQCPSLRELEGECDYCGEECDNTQDELNALSCSFEGCPASVMYHQHCVEAYLKSIRLDKQRKTGFQCPRGCGKGSKSEKPCPGRVIKSHPIHARNDSSKKRRKAKVSESAPIPVPQASSKKPSALSKSNSLKEKGKFTKTGQEGETTVSKTLRASILNRASSFPTQKFSVPSGIEAGTAGSSKNGPHVIGRLEKSYAEMASEIFSPQTSVSDDDNIMQLRKLTCPQDVKPTVGRNVAVASVVNAWATGRPLAEVLLASSKDGRPQSPSHPPQTQKNFHSSCSSVPNSLHSDYPSKITATAMVVEDDDLEARRQRARTKNEKKHLQRAAAKLRSRRELEQTGVTSTSPTVVPPSHYEKSLVVSSEVPQAASLSNASVYFESSSSRPWSQSTISALQEWKLLTLVRQLEDFGFVDWQAAMAVKICGIDVHMCIDWLLKNGAYIKAEMPLGQSQGFVDVNEELRRLQDIVKAENYPQNEVERLVEMNGGNIDAALIQLRYLKQSSKAATVEERYQPLQMDYLNPGLDNTAPKHMLGTRSLSSLSCESWQNYTDNPCDGTRSVTLSSSVKSSDSDSNFGPFCRGFVSDVARYNALVGMCEGPPTSQDLKEPSLVCHVDNHFPLKVQERSSEREAHLYGLNSRADGFHANILHEPVSTVTSVAASVLNENFGADEQYIASLMEVIYDESPAIGTINSTTIGDIWSFPSSPGFSLNRNLAAPPGFGPFYSSDVQQIKQSNVQSFFSLSKDFRLNSDPLMLCDFSIRKGSQTEQINLMRNNNLDQPRTAMDDAEEQEKLLSQLLSQLLS